PCSRQDHKWQLRAVPDLRARKPRPNGRSVRGGVAIRRTHLLQPPPTGGSTAPRRLHQAAVAPQTEPPVRRDGFVPPLGNRSSTATSRAFFGGDSDGMLKRPSMPTGAPTSEPKPASLVERRARRIANARSVTLGLAVTFLMIALAGAIV